MASPAPGFGKPPAWIPHRIQWSIGRSAQVGVTDDAELWAWRKKSIDGTIERKNGSIVLCDDTGEEKVRWNFVGGWPTKWTWPTFNATGNEVTIETLEIAHEGLGRWRRRRDSVSRSRCRLVRCSSGHRLGFGYPRHGEEVSRPEGVQVDVEPLSRTAER